MEDNRITTARDVLRGEEDRGNWSPLHSALADVIDYAEERLRVNVGLMATQKTKDVVLALDVSDIPNADLLAELAHRLENGS